MTDMTKAIQPQDQQRELLLTQNEHDRTLYELPGVGTLRTGGYFGGAGATISVGGVTWQCAREAMWAHRYGARDTSGQLDGRFARPWFGAARGTLQWGGKTYEMPATGSRAPYFELKRGHQLFATFAAAKTTGPTPVRVELHHELPLDTLMFATYIAAEFAARAARAAAGGGSGADGGGWFDGSGSDGGGCGGGSSGCSGGGGCGGGGCGGGS